MTEAALEDDGVLIDARRLFAAPDDVLPDSTGVDLDEAGEFVMVGGVRLPIIPLRNAGPLPGMTALEDWQQAVEVDRMIRAGEGVDAQPLSWKNISGAILSHTTDMATGWSTTTVVGEPGALLWAASGLVWIPAGLWATFTLNVGVVLLYALAVVAWTAFCLRFTESPRSIARKNAR